MLPDPHPPCPPFARGGRGGYCLMPDRWRQELASRNAVEMEPKK